MCIKDGGYRSYGTSWVNSNEKQNFLQWRLKKNICINSFPSLIILNDFFLDCRKDIKYEGRKYVSEGSPIFISCLKTAYGVPKWSKNGQTIKESDFTLTEEILPDNFVQMELRADNASWRHRGIYKCDPQSDSSHPIEIVISKGIIHFIINNHFIFIQLRPDHKMNQ